MSQARPRIWSHPTPGRRSFTRAPAWVLVGLLHLMVALTLWKQAVWADRVAAVVDRPPLVVTLWQQVRQATATTQVPTVAARRDPAPRPRPRAPEPQAITLPSTPFAPSAPSPSAPAEPAAAAVPSPTAPAAESAAPPLNLVLPRGASAPWRQRNPALDDPRSNTAKLTLEQKLANAMGGDGSWQMERLDNDRIRYRRGDECVLLTRSRAGQLELGNGTFRNAWMAGNC